MMDYHRQNNVDIRLARIFNTYGPRMLETTAEWFRICSTGAGAPGLTIYGKGDQTRSFLLCR